MSSNFSAADYAINRIKKEIKEEGYIFADEI